MVEVEVEVDDEEVENEKVEDEGEMGHGEVEDEGEIGDDEVQDDLPTVGGYPPWAFKGGLKGATCSVIQYYIMCGSVLNLL